MWLIMPKKKNNVKEIIEKIYDYSLEEIMETGFGDRKSVV